MKIRALRISITVVALLIALLHTFFPEFKIDGITLVLLIVALVPWFALLFKSLEFPGGWKVEFRDFLKVQDEARKVGLLASEEKVEWAQRYSFQLVSEEDPNLALAGLRIEIEKRLIQLAGLEGDKHRKEGVRQLLKILSQQGILTTQERSVLAELISLLNSAVHGATIDKRAAEWAMEVGPRILQALDDKIESQH